MFFLPKFEPPKIWLNNNVKEVFHFPKHHIETIKVTIENKFFISHLTMGHNSKNSDQKRCLNMPIFIAQLSYAIKIIHVENNFIKSTLNISRYINTHKGKALIYAYIEIRYRRASLQAQNCKRIAIILAWQLSILANSSLQS